VNNVPTSSNVMIEKVTGKFNLSSEENHKEKKYNMAETLSPVSPKKIG
jgi:hypothetical protein